MQAKQLRMSYVVLNVQLCHVYHQRWQVANSAFVCVYVTLFNLQSDQCVRDCESEKKKMNPHSLFASAAINIGLALVTLTLFSIFKKQPSFAPIYYARRLSNGQQIHFHDETFSFRRFLPSVSWIPRAFRVTEDEILDSSGLDALVIIRLFKFGSVFICF